jgi:hypothetical protein
MGCCRRQKTRVGHASVPSNTKEKTEKAEKRVKIIELRIRVLHSLAIFNNNNKAFNPK